MVKIAQNDGLEERQDAFLRLFSQYSRRIYAFVLTILPNYTDADEVFQNTSVVLWKKFDSYDPSGSFVSWACRIAHLEMLAMHRKSRKLLPFDNEVMQCMIDELDSREDSHPFREEALRECIEKLGASDRRLVEQRYYLRKAPKVIAGDADKSVHSIYRALSRIHVALRDCVERNLRREIAQ